MYILAANLMDHVVEHDLLRIFIPAIRTGGEQFYLHFTNQMLMALVAAVLMLLIFPRLFASAQSDAPTGARNAFEAVIEYLHLEVFRPALKENTDRFLPYLLTLFFFILFSNLLGLIPFATIIELLSWGHVKEIGGTATGNIWNTAALAVLAFVIIHVSGVVQVFRDLVRGTYGHHDDHSAAKGHGAESHIGNMRAEAAGNDAPQNFDALTDPTHHYNDSDTDSHRGHGHGAGKSHFMAALLAIPIYIWNFAPHPFRPQEGEPSWKWAMDIPMWFMLLILELMGALIKPFSLAMRLFANMIGGHLVLAALLTLTVMSPHILTQIGIGIPVVLLSVFISVLELLVAFLQAYIFTFLTTLFIASAVAPEH